jgi:hypothetical protein
VNVEYRFKKNYMEALKYMGYFGTVLAFKSGFFIFTHFNPNQRQYRYI